MGIFFIKDLRNLITGILIGLLVGLWFGANLAQGRAVFSNPFANATIQSKIKKAGDKVLEQGGLVLEKSGKALRDAISSDK